MTHFLEVDYVKFDVSDEGVGELHHQVHEFRHLFVVVIDELDFPECQPVQPVHLIQMPFSVLLS